MPHPSASAALLLTLLTAPAIAREPRITLDPTAPVPFNPEIRVDHLDNGLTVYVLPNAKPEARAELRLVVKAGSILEDPDQLGLAHFTEHMAFNGTTHFPHNELESFLERVGVSFGADLNAYTSFDETVYKLHVPTDDAALLDTGLTVLHDWANGITFDPEECEKERGVVLEEWRLHQGLEERERLATGRMWWGTSRYADRMPIGTEENLRGFHCDAARRYYQTWYRPNLMAVFAVGDFDADAMVRTIRDRFSDLKNPKSPAPRTRYHVSLDDPPLTVVYADSERTRPTVWIADRAVDRWGGDHADFTARALDGLIGDIFDERFEQLTEDPASPMVEASIWTESLAWERGNHLAWATPKEGREAEAMAALFTEIERARRFGFTEAEVDRARADTLIWLRSAYEERDKSDHVDAIEELIRVFLIGESAPGIAYEYAFAKRTLPRVSAAQLSERFRTEWFQGRARALTALLTEKPGLTPPTVAELNAIPGQLANAAITPFPAQPPLGPLVSSPPKPGTARRVEDDPEYGLSTWALSNGATLLLLPTEHQDDEVLLNGWSPGGHGLVPESELIAAMSAASVLGNSGFGNLTPSQLSRALAGKDVSAWASLGELYEGLGGNASAKDLDTMLQLVWLHAAEPRFTDDGFALTLQQYTESLTNRKANPDLVFEDAWQRLMWGEDPRRDPWDLTDLPAMDRATSERVWRARFQDFSDWTFLIVGNITPNKAVRSAERWLASLPATGKPEAWRDNGSHRVDGVHRIELPRGGTDRARVQITFHGDTEPTLSNWDQLHGVAELIDLRLRETLREELGGVYGPSASAGMRFLPTGTYTLTVRFECAPDRLAELEAAAWAVVERVRTEAATEDEVAAIREQARRDHETSLTSNQTWQQTVYSARVYGWSLHDAIDGWEARNTAKTPASLQASAQAWLNPKRVLVGVLKP